MVEISHTPYSTNLNPANFFTITKVKVTFKGRFQDFEDVKNITAPPPPKKKCALVLESKHTFRLYFSNIKSTIPAFKVCVFDEQYDRHFWTMLGSLQCVVLVMIICHLLDLVTKSALSCSHTCTECRFAWVVTVGNLTPVFCQVYTRRMLE